MKAESGKRLIRSLLGGVGLLIFAAGFVNASEAKPPAREVSVTLNAGESFVIKDVSKDATPAVHVVSNPNAMIVHSDPSGGLVLLGTEAGSWKISVKSADGEQVVYKIQVNSIKGPSADPLAPGKMPTPLGSSSFGSSADRSSAVAALDSGSGPVIAEPVVAKPAMAASSADDAAGAALAPVGGAAAMTAAAIGATAPAASPASPAPALIASSAGSGSGGIELRPVPAPMPAAAPAPAPVMMAANGASLPQTPAPSTYTKDSMYSGSVMPSQSIITNPDQNPPQNYKSDPMAPTRGESINGGTHYLPNDVVDLSAGSSRVYDFARRIRRISIADTGVADVQVINPYQINLIGHKEGFTTLAVWDNRGQYDERQIRVDPFGPQQVMLNVIVAELDRNRIEGQGINWSFALPKYNVSLVGLGGQVATQYTGSSNLTATQVFGAGSPSAVTTTTTATGTLPSPGTLIPLLLSTNVNYGLAAGNSNVQTQTFFEALEEHNLAKILAEPHLLANSGEKAEFLSGGEIPIVISQALNTSIEFKQFGTSVIFVPTVIGSDIIGLRVKPEVSQPDYSHGVNLFGFTVPAFVTRRAETYVRLRNNQTLIIAGLLLHTKTSNVQKTPYLGDLPYIGMLFKSTSYQENQTDLVMSVTPQIVSPLPDNGQVALPTDRSPMTASEIRTREITPADASRPRF